MTSTDALIRDLSSELAPVQRRSAWREIATLLALGAAELALILLAGFLRPDMAQIILSPLMVWKIGSLTLLAGLSCGLAVRSFAPPIPSRGGTLLVAGAAVLAIVAGVLATPAGEAGRSILERLAPVHGLFCAIAIVVLSLPLMGLLAVLMRRAAPVQPRRSASASGLAAATCGALVFTACCPMNDPLYIVVWYSVGVAAVTAASRWLLPWRFRL